MKNRKNKSKHSSLDSIIHHNFLSMNKQLARRDAILLDSGFYDTDNTHLDLDKDITKEKKEKSNRKKGSENDNNHKEKSRVY